MAMVGGRMFRDVKLLCEKTVLGALHVTNPVLLKSRISLVHRVTPLTPRLVTTTATFLPARPLIIPKILLDFRGLSREAGLLNTSIPGPTVIILVTVICRTRLLERLNGPPLPIPWTLSKLKSLLTCPTTLLCGSFTPLSLNVTLLHIAKCELATRENGPLNINLVVVAILSILAACILKLVTTIDLLQVFPKKRGIKLSSVQYKADPLVAPSLTRLTNLFLLIEKSTLLNVNPAALGQ